MSPQKLIEDFILEEDFSEEAINVFLRLIEGCPEFSAADYLSLARNQKFSGSGRVEQLLAKGLERFPSDGLLLNSLCDVYRGTDRFSAGAFIFEQNALANGGYERELESVKAWVLYGDYHRARALVERFLERAGEDQFAKAKCLAMYGQIEVAAGNANPARDYLLSALDLDPSCKPAAQTLLPAAALSGDMAAVVNLYFQLEKNQWLTTEIVLSLLQILANSARYENCVELFDLSVDKFSLPLDAYQIAMEASRALGQEGRSLGQLELARKKFGKLENPSVLLSECHSLAGLGRFEELDKVVPRLLNNVRGRETTTPLNPWMFFSLVDDPLFLKDIAVSFSENVFGSSNSERSADRAASTALSRKMRIAFYSADLRAHPVTECLLPILENTPGDIEVFLLSLHPSSDAYTKKLRSLVEGFHDCSGMDYRSTRALVDELSIDILVDLTCYTSGGRPAFVAKGLAPIQVNFLGFSGTTGSSAYDFIVADRYILADEYKKYYTETPLLIDLPLLSMNFGSLSLEGARKAEREALDLGDDDLLLVCLAKPYKINNATIDAWSKIMSTADQTRLLVAESSAVFVKKALSDRGINPGRIVAGSFRSSRTGHLRRLSACDLFLDTFPYNAHSLAADCIMAGVPVLAMSGGSFASRVSGALMTGVGLHDFVVTSYEQYTNVAVSFASDPERRASVRAALADQLSSRHWGKDYAEAFFSGLRTVL